MDVPSDNKNLNYKRMRGLFVIKIYIILLNLTVYSQNIKIVKNNLDYKTIYTINEENLNPIKKIKFNHGGNKYGFDIFNTNGTKLNKENKFSIQEYSWTKDFQKPIQLLIDSTNININVYLKNISSYVLKLKVNNDYFIHKINILYDGYQNTKTFSLKSIIPDSCSHLYNHQISIESLEIKIIPKTYPFTFIISDLSILKLKTIENEINYPFFDILTNRNSFDSIKQSSICDKNINNLILTASYKKISSGKYYIKKLNDKYSDSDLVLDIFEKIFKYYPMYKYSDYNEKYFINKINILRDLNLSYCNIIDSLKNYVKKVGDPHFHFTSMSMNCMDENRKTNTRKSIAPIHFFKFQNKIYVKAVFDTLLGKKMSPGDELIYSDCLRKGLKYNDKSYDSLIKKEVNQYNLNLKCKNDYNNIILTKNKNGDTICTVFDVDSSYILIPSNFKPKDAELIIFDKKICYFKINKFTRNIYSQMLLNKNKFLKSKGIIIDLRNCGGGNLAYVIRLISWFIDKNTILWNDKMIGIDNLKESIVIKPDKKIHFSSPVCILIDKKTACAAECFAYLMNKNCDAVIIGASNSRGAISRVFKLVFPDGLCISFNCLNHMELYPEIDIENVGLTPNILVSITEVKDLYPYNDKVLKTAIKFLNEDP